MSSIGAAAKEIWDQSGSMSGESSPGAAVFGVLSGDRDLKLARREISSGLVLL
jgi:hypothetical protein